MPGNPVQGELRIATSDQYRLYVDGRQVGDGPARSEVPVAYVDSHRLSELGLRKGTNCVAVLAHSTMMPQHGQSLVPGGFRAALVCRDAAGHGTHARQR